MFGFSSLRCVDCEYLDTKDKNRYGEYYCPEAREYVDPNSYTCKYFVPNYYIMTVYSMIKKLPFDNYNMLVLINLRDKYMTTNDAGIDFLKEYNSIGPEIALRLLNDMYRTDIIDNLEEKYINPAVRLTINGDLETAQKKYIEMFNTLKIRYGYEENKRKIKRL